MEESCLLSILCHDTFPESNTAVSDQDRYSVAALGGAGFVQYFQKPRNVVVLLAAFHKTVIQTVLWRFRCISGFPFLQ